MSVQRLDAITTRHTAFVFFKDLVHACSVSGYVPTLHIARRVSVESELQELIEGLARLGFRVWRG
jgi:hypothetical protein